MRDTTHTIAANLRALMQRDGLSQMDLAKRTGIAQTTISNVLRPDPAKSPKVGTLDAIAEHFRIPTWMLLAQSPVFAAATDAEHLLDCLSHTPKGARQTLLGVAELAAHYQATAPTDVAPPPAAGSNTRKC